MSAGVVVIAAGTLLVVLTRDDGDRTASQGSGSIVSSASSRPPTSTAPSTSSAPTGAPSAPPRSGSTSSVVTTSTSASGTPQVGGGGTPRPTPPPVSLTATANPATGLTARLARIESVQGISNLPGEIAGPSLRVTVEYDNGTPTAIDLRGAVVNLYTGKNLTPAIALTQPGARPFPSSVAAGQKAQGVFVFNVPQSLRSLVRVEVDLSNQGNVVLFQGSVT